ncbi:hypothetical protein PSACC_02814 [Paramicrosporidium saccamoebae]|uniref:PHD-type domain-containing protein n=1 Tax=Paramicrosporidium saccamoebae TaxID=1246581 RepID=A0A2H9THX3_9FUNG|nr:hypothetical protein PSACC_02814 [Paramicrosporidium saccamoebae]
MASGAKVESVGKPSVLSPCSPVGLKDSNIVQLSTSSLADLCQRLRVQLIAQRLPLLCSECRPNLVRAFKMELNLTQMLRGLCGKCKLLFMSSPGERTPAKPILPRANVVKVEGQGQIKKVILKMAPGKGRLTKKTLRNDRPIYEAMTTAGMDWCRYCGTTNGVNWRPGPWGQRTLCNKHGCSYHGFGISTGLARLDLSLYEKETILDRMRPVLQENCSVCLEGSSPSESLVCCYACPKSYHHRCLPVDRSVLSGDSKPWFCSSECPRNFTRRSISVSSPVKERVQRALSVPTPTLGKRKFAKRFDVFAAPPTPPTTPPSVSRKRRATADVSSQILVCFEPDAVVKKHIPDRKEVFTPLHQLVTFPPLQCSQTKVDECLMDEGMLDRHARYEEVEKTMRLCRPQVLNTLFKGNASIVSDRPK